MPRKDKQEFSGGRPRWLKRSWLEKDEVRFRLGYGA